MILENPHKWLVVLTSIWSDHCNPYDNIATAVLCKAKVKDNIFVDDYISSEYVLSPHSLTAYYSIPQEWQTANISLLKSHVDNVIHKYITKQVSIILIKSNSIIIILNNTNPIITATAIYVIHVTGIVHVFVSSGVTTCCRCGWLPRWRVDIMMFLSLKLRQQYCSFL